MKKFLVLLILCLFTLPVMAEKTILIMGDSLSASHGFEPKNSWVTLLGKRLQEEKYDYRVVNLSVSGNTTSNGLAALPTALKKYNPAITIIELGGNDGLRGLLPAVVKKNLQRMITLAKQSESKVLLLGVRLPPNYGPAYIEQFQQIFTGLGKEENISVVPLLLKGVDDNPALMQADGVHPVSGAQKVILENIWLVLKGML